MYCSSFAKIEHLILQGNSLREKINISKYDKEVPKTDQIHYPLDLQEYINIRRLLRVTLTSNHLEEAETTWPAWMKQTHKQIKPIKQQQTDISKIACEMPRPTELSVKDTLQPVELPTGYAVFFRFSAFINLHAS